MRQERIDASQMELLEKVVSIKRVTKVVKGGRNFRFTALVVVGDGNGHVGAGLGKATEIPEAIRKGKEDAMKKMIEITFDENGSITHDVLGKFGSASVLLKKAPGFSSLYVNDFEKEQLKYYFPEFGAYDGLCRFSGCDHVHEPDCAVKQAAEEGKIHEIRYNDYVAMYRELQEKRRY